MFHEWTATMFTDCDVREQTEAVELSSPLTEEEAKGEETVRKDTKD